MLGGLGAFLTAEISGAVKRRIIVLGLFGLSGFLLACAGFYALGALHTELALRLGATAASLWIAGGFGLVGLVVLGLAFYVKGRKRPARPVAATAMAAAPIALQLLGSRRALRFGLMGGLAALGILLGRQIVKGGDEPDDET